MDQNIFRNNYNTIINFINQFTSESITPEQLKQIKVFISNFSFYTYFQFFQNDFMKLFVEDYLKNKDFIVFDNSIEININNYLVNTTSFIVTYTKVVYDIFTENKTFTKILPNLFKLLSHSMKFVLKRVLMLKCFKFDVLSGDITIKNLNCLVIALDNLFYFYEKSFVDNIKQLVLREKNVIDRNDDINIMTLVNKFRDKTMLIIKDNLYFENFKIIVSKSSSDELKSNFFLRYKLEN